MRRIAILLALVALDMWLIGSSERSGGLIIPVLLNNSVSAQSCCPPGTGDSPYWGCLNGQCVEFQGCGFTDCSPCQGCDPDDEQYCLDIGWIWDPENCVCNPPTGCDPEERDACIMEECDWDDLTCTCTCQQSCNPGPPELVGFDSWTFSYCVSCYIAEGCTTETDYYVRYCQDGSVYDSWTQQVSYCTLYFAWECDQDYWCNIW